MFEFEQFQPLEYTQNQFQNNLTAVLSFYAFIVIGMDYDSYSPFGGESYFQIAQEIINNIPPNASAVYKGWRSVDSNRNRYWIAENMLSGRMRGFRQAIYDYHRQGLDLAHKDFPTGRAIMVNALKSVAEAEKSYPRAMAVQMFANSKSDEIVEVFTLNKVKHIQKPCAVYNVNGFYNKLIELMMVFVDYEYMDQASLEELIVADNSSDLMKQRNRS